MSTLKRIWKGLFWSEKYGSHPGTFILIWLLALGLIAGGWIGLSIFFVSFVPLYLAGAYERGK